MNSAFLRDHITILDVATAIDISAFEQALDLRTVEVAAVPFEVGLALLQKFAERERHARVQAKHVEDGYLLGRWVDHRRGEWRSGMLTRERKALIEAIPGWTWTPIDDDWQLGLDRLRQYGQREGNPRVSNSHIEDGFRLGQWWPTDEVISTMDGSIPNR